MDGFEWDEGKHLANVEKHKVGFDYIADHFSNDTNAKETPDDRKDYGEKRVIRIMKIGDIVYQTVYTMRKENIRLISARIADDKEKRIYRD